MLRKVKKHRPKKKTAPKPHQTNNIIGVAHNKYGKKFALYLKILDLAALRKAEGLSIKPIDCEYSNGVARIKIHGKGNRERWVILPVDFYQKLMEFVQYYDIQDSEPIFDFDYDKTQIMFGKACIEAGYYNEKPVKNMKTNPDGTKRPYMTKRRVPMFSLHRLRHGRATIWDVQKEQLTNISKKLGHSDISTTQIYIDTDEKELLKSWANNLKEDLKERVMISEGYDETSADEYVKRFFDSIPERKGDTDAI